MKSFFFSKLALSIMAAVTFRVRPNDARASNSPAAVVDPARDERHAIEAEAYMRFNEELTAHARKNPVDWSQDKDIGKTWNKRSLQFELIVKHQ